jgi:Ser/Thr protein kinase RdoA (MazF antagonist)
MDRAIATARRFGLGDMHAISQFESFGNENWLYESADGRFVLRRYLHAGLNRVRFQLDLAGYLRTNGFPAAPVLSAPDGDQACLDADGVPWVVFAYLAGREYNFSSEDAGQAARLLARFHTLGQRLETQPPALLHRPAMRDCWRNARSDVAELRRMFEGSALTAELDYLDEWWTHVLAIFPVDRLNALPAGLVHGDFHGRNLAYVDGQLEGLFDFDDVERAPLVQDLAWSLHKFARESRFSLRLRPEVVRVFMAEYTGVRPLTAAETHALPTMLAMSYPPNPAYYRYYRDHHGSNIENRLRREVHTMRMLRSQAEVLFGPA